MSARARYDLEERLSDGRAGAVYRARQRSSGGRLVALKRVRASTGADELYARMRRVIETLAALDHPHIVRVYEVMPDGAGIAIAMQYAPEGSLADRLAVEGRLDWHRVISLAVPIAQALSAAHAAGVVHGSVTTRNILFGSDGQPLLSDFGLAPGPLTAAADVYDLGRACYEALTGRQPGATPAPVTQAAPDCPRSLALVIDRAVAIRPEVRYTNAGDLATALRTAPIEPPPSRQIEPAFDPARYDTPRRWRTLPIAITAVLAVGLAIAGILLLPRTRPEAGPPGSPAPLAEQEPSAAPAAPPSPPSPPSSQPSPQPQETVAQAASCPPLDIPDLPEGETVFQADTDGDGCASVVRWDGMLLTLAADSDQPGPTYRLGEDGDQLVLGDWDCDGIDTPALYRPSTGQVYLFNGWAGPGQDMPAEVGPALDPDGQATVVDGSDCGDTVGLNN